MKDDNSVKVNEYFKTSLRTVLLLESLNVIIDETTQKVETQLSEISFNLLRNTDFSRFTNLLLFKR
jgi:hypothetical protein